MKTTLIRILICVVVISVSATVLAQTTAARLQGTVADPSGAVVSGATVSATNTATNRVDTVQTDGAGNYVFPSLAAGPYKLEVKQAGFAGVVQEITLQTQQVAALNFTLKVGQTTDTVTVSEDVPLVESTTSALSSVVTGTQIVNLPINGRNFTELATLVPGVTRGVQGGQATGSGNQAETFRNASSGGASLSVNGLRPQNNNFLLDGVDNNESLVNTIIFFPPAEAIQEFRVDTSVAPAEFGRAGGGVVNTAIKSGTNTWHGSAFEFLRNNHLDATPYFNQKRPQFRRNQFGGTLGGAIVKNKLFVFGDYQGLRQFQPLGQDRATVPTDLMRKGDFSELLALSSPIVITNPVTHAAFAGNVIDPSYIIKAGSNYLAAYPEPNVAGSNPLCGQVNTKGVCIKQNYVVNRNNIQHYNDFDVRVDYNLRQQDTIFGRYSYGKDYEVASSRLPNLPAGFGSGTQKGYPRSFVFGETHTFSTTVVNEFRFGWIHTEMGYTPPFQNEALAQSLGIPNANTTSVLGGGALIGGYNDQLEYTGDYGPYIVPEQTWNFSDSLSWIHGQHTFKFSANVMRRQVNLFRPKAGKGYFFLFGNGGGQSPTGYEVSDILAGFMNNYQVGPALGFSHTRNWETGYSAQDDWRVTRRLTLNLGIRYDLYTWPTETKNLQANFVIPSGCFAIIGTKTPCTGSQLVLAGTNGASDSLINTDKHDFAPRVGFAYDLFGDGKTVLRGGFGIFYFLDRGGIDNQLAQNAPFSGVSTYNYSDGYRFNLAGIAAQQAAQSNTNPNPTTATATGMPGKGPISINLANPQNVSLVSYPVNDRTPSAQEWNLQVQRQLGSNMSASVGYVATHGVHLMTLINLNRQVYNAASGVKPFPGLGDVNLNGTIGNSTYHALQAQLQRRLANGVQFQASYTWSHNIDDSPGTLDQQSDRVDWSNFGHERANSNLDLRHNLVISGLYELPFGKGRTFGGNMSGIANAIAGGWQINPSVSVQSGMPFDLISSYQGLRTRPDLVGSLHELGSIKKWFDTSAFKDPPTVNIGGTGTVFARPGNAPRNAFFGPGHAHLDVALFKNFKITERFNAQYRAQFYNVTNHPQFGQPNGDVSSGDFGTVKSSTFTGERQIEMAFRISF